MAGDPVRLGIVHSLSRPGGNVTGVTNIGLSLERKRLELLSELIPGTKKIAYLVNPDNPNSEPRQREFEAAAASLGKQAIILPAAGRADFQNLFERLRVQRVDALVVLNDAVYVNSRRDIIAAAHRHKIPTIYPFREFPVDGGLLSYGADLSDTYRKAGTYVGRILDGAKPSDLPVLQLDKFNLTLNAKAAKELGLKMSPSFLIRVDETIE